jgi:hypothetical protein
MARPKLDIDPEKVRLLAECFCTNEEIAAKLGCSSDTLVRRFAEPIKSGRDSAKSTLREYQFAMAKTNPAMAIWLGKQYLNQHDKIIVNITPHEADKLIDGSGAPLPETFHGEPVVESEM